MWQWNGTPDELLDYWCKVEDIRNDEMIELVKKIRQAGTACYLATEQEQHRGNYMKDVMFKSLFDDYFVTAEVGYKKSDTRFFEEIPRRLSETHSTIKPEDIMFFDDSQSKVDSATEAGIDGYLFDGVDGFKKKIAESEIYG